MRIRAYAASLLALLALAGCSGDGEQPTWSVDNLVDVDDATLVGDFNAYADAVDEPWRRTPVTLVAEMLRLDSSDNPNLSVVSVAAAEAAERATVTVTSSRLLDDSVEATRNVVDVVRDGDVWRVEAMESSFSCKPGRGHQDFSTEPCA